MSLARSSSPGAPGYEPPEIQDLRRAYGGPDGDDFDAHTFEDVDDATFDDAMTILNALEKRRYSFSSPEMSDMYFSALAGIYYRVIVERSHKPPACFSFSKKANVNEPQNQKNIYNRRKSVLKDVESCHAAFMRLKAIYDRLLRGAKDSATSTSARGSNILKQRLALVEQLSTMGNLSELKKGAVKLAEEGWVNRGGRRRNTRRTRRTRKGSRKNRRNTRRN